jgi:hypothetical protein
MLSRNFQLHVQAQLEAPLLTLPKRGGSQLPFIRKVSRGGSDDKNIISLVKSLWTPWSVARGIGHDYGEGKYNVMPQS